MEIIEEFHHGGVTLRIMRDSDPIDPRTHDNLATIILLSHEYDLGDDRRGLKHTDFETFDQFYRYVFDVRGAIWARPIQVRDYGYVTQLDMIDWPITDWNPNRVGLIYVTEERIQELCGPGDQYRTLEFAIKTFESELKEYNQWLDGDVYGFELVEPCTCPKCKNKHEETLDSCWGYYGQDWQANGLLEAAGWRKTEDGRVMPEEDADEEEDEAMRV